MDFKEGDTVMLKSGGPRMTVEEVGDGYVACVWFDKGNAKRETFAPALLSKASVGMV